MLKHIPYDTTVPSADEVEQPKDYPAAEHVTADRSLGRVILIALNALSLQSAQWAALVLTFILFGAAITWPDTKRIIAACAFAVLVQLPLWWRRS